MPLRQVSGGSGVNDWQEVGYRGRLDPYEAVIDVRCKRCKADPGTKCVNQVTGHARRIPCYDRGKK
jgi:hypothetical protein